MFSVGVDIIEISRFKNANYLNRVAEFFLTPEELREALNSSDKYQHLASRFAAKEAVIKAIPEPSNYMDFEIVKQDKKPVVKFLRPELTKYKVALSLSHSEGSAIAFAAAQTI